MFKNTSLKEIMTRVWKIAKEAVERFGGKVKAYFNESLKQAWEESRTTKLTVAKWFHDLKCEELGKRIDSFNIFAILVESEKAYKVFVADNKRYITYWIPKKLTRNEPINRSKVSDTIFCSNVNRVYRKWVNSIV